MIYSLSEKEVHIIHLWDRWCSRNKI